MDKSYANLFLSILGTRVKRIAPRKKKNMKIITENLTVPVSCAANA